MSSAKRVFLAFFITGLTLAVLSLLREGTIQFGQIFTFWVKLLPIVIAVVAARWVYADCQRRSIPHAYLWSFSTVVLWIITLPIYSLYRLRFAKSLDLSKDKHAPNKFFPKGFGGVIGVYLGLNTVIGFIIFGLAGLFLFKLPVSFLNLPGWGKEGEVFREKYANIPPPQSLNIGGLGPNTIYNFESELERIPEGYNYTRTDLRGYKIYATRTINQTLEPVSYAEVVVENPGKWISLYKLRT